MLKVFQVYFPGFSAVYLVFQRNRKQPRKRVHNKRGIPTISNADVVLPVIVIGVKITIIPEITRDKKAIREITMRMPPAIPDSAVTIAIKAETATSKVKGLHRKRLLTRDVILVIKKTITNVTLRTIEIVEISQARLLKPMLRINQSLIRKTHKQLMPR